MPRSSGEISYSVPGFLPVLLKVCSNAVKSSAQEHRWALSVAEHIYVLLAIGLIGLGCGCCWSLIKVTSVLGSYCWRNESSQA